MRLKDKTGVSHWNGATQNDRLLKSLLPEYIKIDERSSSDLLAFAAKYAELIKYYSLKNDVAGDWTRFFKDDISIFLATIISTDLRKIEREHNRFISILENAPRAEEKLEALEDLFIQVLNLAKQINDWYVHALQMNKLNPMESSKLENELENAIKQQLSRNLIQLVDYQKDLEFVKASQFSADNIEEHFHSIWFKKHQLIGARDIDIDDANVENKIRSYTKKIRIQFRTFYSVTAYILQIAPRYLKQTLEEKANHKPDVGLFIAFVELFKNVQDQLNGMTEKHLDFYYYDVLKQRERGFTPDKANVYFTMAKHIDTHFLEKGTLVSGGRDEDGIEHFYTTNEGIELNRAKIESLRTLFVSKNPKIGIGSSYRLITNMYGADIANSKDGRGSRFINDEEDWPTFGQEILEIPEDERQMTYADIGWAVAAPVLEMEEGHRIVTMRFEFERDSMTTFNLLIKDLSRNQDVSREDAFSKVFKDSLEVFFSTSEGWGQATTCEVLPPSDWGKPEISIVATLSAAEPAVVGYNSDLGSDFDTNAPVVKIVHKNKDTIFSYSFLKELELKRVFIDIDVKGMKKLMLSTDLGGINASVPFQPFGPIPRVGSYMLIGKSELFKKEVTDLNLNINWHNIPDNKKGLRGYYKEYGLGLKNDSFKVKLTALSDGEFYPTKEDAPLEYRLFEDDEDNPQTIGDKTNLTDVDVKALNIKPIPNFKLPSAFGPEVRDGFLKLELITPKGAFAHNEFASVYAETITHNTSPKKKGPDKALPNQPYSPVARSMTLDYSASAQVNVVSIGTINKGDAVAEELYHIHPYGVIRTFHKGRSSNRSLVPSYDENAYLFIGLKDLTPPTNLSVYFELKENLDLFSGSPNQANKPEVYWSYMANDEWKHFSQNQILSDTTNGFNNSGIVMLDIPRDLTNQNYVLPNNQHWLRVTVRGDATRMPRTLKVATQAVGVTWVNNGAGTEHLSKPVESNSIKRLASPIAQIRGVNQPFPSFGGRPGETKKEFYTRTSERTRHKNRAVSAWDFERIVLDKFPSIYQVKCVTHLGNEKFVESGTVVLVVVPRIKKNQGYHLPMVNYTVLESIKEYLKPLASPFVNIEVRNPIYERVKIASGVRFEKGKNNGTFLKKLNQDIIEFMCPWMVGKGQELELGGSIAKDVLLSFMEKRGYVEFVTKFSAVQVFPNPNGFDVGDTAIDGSSSPIVKATKPWSVLIPFEMNPIYFLDEDTFQSPEKSSINSMIIDGDFVMTEEKDEGYDNYVVNKKRKRKKKD